MSTPSTVLEHVECLYSVGLIAIPLCRPMKDGLCSAQRHERPCSRVGKRPLMTEFTEFAASAPQSWAVRKAFRNHPMSNVAFVTGMGIVVVEADSQAAEDEAIALVGLVLEEAPTRERRPERGRGWLFRVLEGERIASRAHLGASGAIDVRGYGGIFVVPPSVNATGHRYTWLPGRAPWETTPPPLPSALRDLFPNTAPPRSHAQGDEHELPVGTSMPSRVSMLLRSRRHLTELWHGRGKRGGDTSRSGYDHAVARELLFSGVSLEDAATALALRPEAHRRDHAYVVATVTNAHRALPARGRR